MPERTRPRVFLIDGYALIYRAFFAMISRPLTTSKGENTSAAFGLTRFLLKVLEEHKPDYLGVVMDAGSSQRKERYPEYKATREKMPDELRASMPRIRQLLDAFRVPVLELPDCEADDVIGTLARQVAEQGMEAVIVSGDKDFYQLIRDGVSLLNPGRGGPAGVEEEWVDLRNASERLGVPPTQVVDYLALIGDSSDNVPGARGIGPKTAISLIQELGSVEEILARVGTIAQKRAREALIECADSVRMSKELVTIRADLPITLELEALQVREPDREALKNAFIELEFHSLVREYAVPAADVAAKKTLECTYELVQDVARVETVVAEARAAGRVSLDTQGSSTDPLRGELVGLGLTVEPGRAYYLPFGHRGPHRLELDVVQDVQNLPALTSPEMKPLVELLEDAGVAKIGQNLKYDLLALRRVGVTLRGIAFDTMVASYVIDPGRREHSLEALALEFLDHRASTYADVCGKGKDEVPYAEVALEKARDFCCEDSDVALRLAGIFGPELDSLQLRRLYDEIELPLIPVLAEMEWAGIRIDRQFFAETGRKLARDLALIQEEIWKLAGGEFNINSTPQLREILFTRLGLPVVKKTKTGASTDVTVLEELAAQGHELPRLLIEYRQLDKLKGTYVDALPQLINPRSGRIHTSFNQAVAATGRLSSSDPNLQNIPIRTEQGAELRKGFVPDDGFVFLSADYSQIELRILAHMSGDPVFVDAFRRGVDIHRQTAALMFNVSADDVTSQMRGAAKTVNFATIYGIGPHALAGKLGTSYAEAKAFIEEYFRRFPGVRQYLDTQIEFARKHGYIETISGRRRYIPELKAKNFSIRQFGERVATNAPVQGSAADVIKLAMIDIQRELQRRGARTRMLLQVHDELLFEIPREEVEEMKPLVKERMEGAFRLEVPLEVSAGIGENWYECK
ncbi:MAG TPA: DNA polymerase I [Longimicrobiales bacterium]